MIRLLCTTLLSLLLLVASISAQVDIADAGESGIGMGGTLSFSSNLNSYGGNLSYTIRGVADVGMTFASVGGDLSGTITAAQATFLPLQTHQPSAGWSLGGQVRWENASINKYMGVNTIGFGPLLTIDVVLSPKTNFQLAGSYIYADNNRSEDGLGMLTVNGGLIAKGNSSNFFVTAGASIPSEGYTALGVQFGLFFKTGTPSEKGKEPPVPEAPAGEGWIN